MVREATLPCRTKGGRGHPLPIFKWTVRDSRLNGQWTFTTSEYILEPWCRSQKERRRTETRCAPKVATAAEATFRAVVRSTPSLGASWKASTIIQGICTRPSSVGPFSVLRGLLTECELRWAKKRLFRSIKLNQTIYAQFARYKAKRRVVPLCPAACFFLECTGFRIALVGIELSPLIDDLPYRKTNPWWKTPKPHRRKYNRGFPRQYLVNRRVHATVAKTLTLTTQYPVRP